MQSGKPLIVGLGEVGGALATILERISSSPLLKAILESNELRHAELHQSVADETRDRNGSQNGRTFHLTFANGLPFHLIGTYQGLRSASGTAISSRMRTTR